MREGFHVTILDNLSAGRMENLRSWQQDPRLKFLRGDLNDSEGVPAAVRGAEVVFHFAANPEVPVGDPSIHFKENVLATFNLLKAIRAEGSARMMIFGSTSTIYGEADQLPTQEDYGPCLPISTYGGSKLACEGLISSYAGTFGLSTCILRFANIVGSRSSHGVISDFIRKLKDDPRRLEILGDGTQNKSYLHVSDCMDACMITYKLTASGKGTRVYNVGSNDQITVMEIARVVAEETGLKDVEFRVTGGVDGGRGWKGDVKYMWLDTSKLRGEGWAPKLNSREAIRLAVREIINDHNRY